MSPLPVLDLFCASLLMVDDAPRAAPALEPDPQSPHFDRHWLAPSAREFPRPSFLRFLENTALAMTRPLRPQPMDVFVIIPALVGTSISLNTDVETHAAIARWPDPVIGPMRLADWASYLGEGWVDLAIFAAMAVIGGRDEQRAAMAGIQALAAVAVVSSVAKVAVREERPSHDPEQQTFFSDRVIKADSFPSGHTMSAFATAAVLANEYPKAAPAFFLLASWVALSRIQNSTHWLTDCIVGSALGLLIGWESYRVTRIFEVEVQPWAGPSGGGVQLARKW